MTVKKQPAHNFQRFSGWRLAALIIVYLLYTIWFVGFGPFGDLVNLQGYSYLQGRGFYSGGDALAAIETLEANGRRIKFTALGFDLIYMILQTWVFEALIALGLVNLGLLKTRWRWFLLMPMGFLLFDFLEDSFLALLLATSLEWVGSFAGMFTFLKMAFFFPLIPISLGLAAAGLVSKILRNRKSSDSGG